MSFDYQQNLKHIVGQGTPASECGAVSALAISADHTTVASGHTSGFIFTWDLSNSAKPFLIIPPLSRKGMAHRAGDGHVSDQAVLHVGFLGTRHTALVSADDSGMAFSHLATRGLGAVGRTVKTTRLLGRYPQVGSAPTPSLRPSTVLAFAPLPLGNVVQPTDEIGLTALLTPYLLVIVSTMPVAQTQFKTARTRQATAHGAMTGCLAWFPAVRLKLSADSAPLKVARTKLAYCWSNILSVLEVEVEATRKDDDEKKPPLHFHVRRHWKSDEAVVAVQWISRSVLALLTVTQRLVILEDQTMHVTDTSDLNSRHIYHRDLFSRQLDPLVSKADQEDKTMHGVVPDAYSMSFKAYKSRLFLLNASDISMGTLSNWADRLVAMMEAGRLIDAIELATVYYNGSADKVTVGLPDDDNARHEMVKERLLQMVSAALRYTFKMDETDELGKDLRTALQELVEPIFTACIEMDEPLFLFDEVYEWYADGSCPDTFFHALEPRVVQQQVTSVPTEALKDMMNWYASLGMAQRLQEMLVSLNTSTLDLDQVTSLCKQLNLFDAYIYVWNQAVEDYVTPLAELIRLAEELDEEPQDSETEERHQSAMKMFSYMAYILTGRIYPDGSEMNATDAETAQAAIYKYLFASTHYIPLRSILSFSTSDLMSTLNEAFEDPFLNEPLHEDGSSVDGDDVVEQTPFTINRQRIVHTLVDILTEDSDTDNRIYLDIFIARNLPKYPQYILLPGHTLQNVLIELCSPPDPELAEECQLSVEYLLSVFRPPNTQALIPLLKRASFYRVLKATYKANRQFSEWLQANFDDADAPEEVFTAIEDSFRRTLGLNSRQTRDAKDMIVEHAQHLADLDTKRTAATIQTCTPDLLDTVYEKLEGSQQARYHFLDALLEGTNDNESLVENFIENHRTDYVSLMCQFEPHKVSGYVATVSSSSLNLDAILPTMERTGVIDAAVVLMANEGLQRNAMDRLIKHLCSLQAALTGTVKSGHYHIFDELVAEIDKYTKMGIWLCQPASEAVLPQTDLGHQAPRTAAKITRDELTDSSLDTFERLWLDLANTITDVSRNFSAAIMIYGNAEDLRLKNSDDQVRRAVHDTFTALLAAATSHPSRPSDKISVSSSPRAPQQPRLLPILGAYLYDLSSTTSSSSQASDHSTLLPILESIFSAHTFSTSLLSLSYKILSKDVFAQYEEVVRRRRRGWRPSNRACSKCGERTWGAGAGVEVWEAWAQGQKRNDKTNKSAWRVDDEGKGKGRELWMDNGSEIEGESRKGVVCFACGHLFHRTCLEQGMNLRAPGADEVEGLRQAYKCLVCH